MTKDDYIIVIERNGKRITGRLDSSVLLIQDTALAETASLLAQEFINEEQRQRDKDGKED